MFGENNFPLITLVQLTLRFLNFDNNFGKLLRGEVFAKKVTQIFIILNWRQLFRITFTAIVEKLFKHILEAK